MREAPTKNFLLVSGETRGQEARRYLRYALIMLALGGLALLVGFLLGSSAILFF